MKKRIVMIGLSVCLLFAAVPGMEVAATGNKAVTNQSIKDKQNQITQAEKEKETLKNNLSDLQKIKKDLEEKKKDLKSYVAQLDSNLSDIEENIAQLKIQITAKEGEIALTE